MRVLLLAILVGICTSARSQIPVELFLGHQRATADIIFFKYFRNGSEGNDRWLFFNRNRASVDYRMTSKTFLPQFGFTEAISYNHPKLKGFAPVLAGQITSAGTALKSGVQFARISKAMTLFTWIVCEVRSKPNIDHFLLFRYMPRISEQMHLFTQLEILNAVPTAMADHFRFIQRLRLGLSMQHWQLGAGCDLSQTGKRSFTGTDNLGVFLRHEF